MMFHNLYNFLSFKISLSVLGAVDMFARQQLYWGWRRHEVIVLYLYLMYPINLEFITLPSSYNFQNKFGVGRGNK